MAAFEVINRPYAMSSLKLKNFRGFESLELQFDRNLNVFVSSNGGGKSALLSAISIALSYFVQQLGGQAQALPIEKSDVRLQKSPDDAMVFMAPTEIEATAFFSNELYSWNTLRKTFAPKTKTTHTKTKNVSEAAQRLCDEIKSYAVRGIEHGRDINFPPALPLIAFYGTGRLWAEHRKTRKKDEKAKNLSEQFGAYLDCLTPASNFFQFETWFEHVNLQGVQELQMGLSSNYKANELIEVIRTAVDFVLAPTEWKNIHWNFIEGCVVAEHPMQGILSVRLLSDGIQNLIALVADLAHRAARLNPHFRFGAAQMTPGIVLIDEVDMHLHPSWQQRVIELLQKAFPLVQFIVSTHSHLVAATVPQDSIRIITTSGSVTLLDIQTEGCESEFVLSQIFGVNSAPPVYFADLIKKYENQIQTKSEDPKIYSELLDHFGENHYILLKINSQIRVRDMKFRLGNRTSDIQNEKNR